MHSKNGHRQEEELDKGTTQARELGVCVCVCKRVCVWCGGSPDLRDWMQIGRYLVATSNLEVELGSVDARPLTGWRCSAHKRAT